MGIIVFLVGARPCEGLNRWMIAEVADQVVVQEFRTVVVVKPQQFEGETGFDVLDLSQYTLCPLLPSGPILGPGGENICHG